MRDCSFLKSNNVLKRPVWPCFYVKNISFELYFYILKEDNFLDTFQPVSHHLNMRVLFLSH